MLKQYSDETIKQIKRIESMRVIHPRLREILSSMYECLQLYNVTAEPQCILVSGDSGAGKSTIIDLFLENIDSALKDRVAVGDIPSSAKVPAFVEFLLGRLGDPFPTRGNVNNKKERLIKILREKRIHLLILDEFQHFVSSQNNKVISDVADFLKSLINETGIPVVILGVPMGSSDILVQNDQLDRRVIIQKELTNFHFSSDEYIAEFRGFLRQLDKMLITILGQSSELDDEEISERIFLAVGGKMSDIMKLIRRAGRIAVLNKHNRVEIEDLAAAFDFFYEHNKDKNNTFKSSSVPEEAM